MCIRHALARSYTFVCLNPLGRIYSTTHYNGISPINIRWGGIASPTFKLYLKKSFYDDSILDIASFSSSNDNFPDLTASIMDLGEAEILALEPLRLDA